jgi:hypothetical protein
MKEILKKIIIFIITLEAKLVLWRFRPKIISVAGSVILEKIKKVLIQK